MSNMLVTVLLCAILKAIKPEFDSEPFYVAIFAAVVIDSVRLISWRLDK